MSEAGSVSSEAGVFHGTPLKDGAAPLWRTNGSERGLGAASLRFPPPSSTSFAAPAPTSVQPAPSPALHEAGIPHLKPPSALLLRDVTNEVARVSAAERALRRLQHENDQLKASEVANLREQAEMRHIISTLQDELAAMESLVHDQVATLKAVSTQMVRLDPYHLVKTRRGASETATTLGLTPASPPSDASSAPRSTLEALRKQVERLRQEQRDAARREEDLLSTKARLEEEVTRLSSNCVAASLTDVEHAHAQEELLRNFTALEAFACQWCAHQNAAHSPGNTLGPRPPFVTDLLHVTLRFLSCVDASVLIDGWRNREPSAESCEATASAISLPSVRLVAKDALQRPLLTVVAERSAAVDAADFDVAPDACDATDCGVFTCVASSRWSITFNVETVPSADRPASVLASTSFPVSALAAVRKRSRHRPVGSRHGPEGSGWGQPQTLCLPLQLSASTKTSVGAAAKAQAAALTIERECGTLCVEVTVTSFDALWRRCAGEAPNLLSAQAPVQGPSPTYPALPHVPTPTAVPLHPSRAPAKVPSPMSAALEVTHGGVCDVDTAVEGEVTASSANVPCPPVVVPPPAPAHAESVSESEPAESAPLLAGLPVVPAPVPTAPTKPVNAVAGSLETGSEGSVRVGRSVDAASQSVASAPPQPTEAGDAEATVIIEIKSARDLLEHTGTDGDGLGSCNPRVQAWLGEQLCFTTPLVHQGRSPSWTSEQGRVVVHAHPSTAVRFDVQDVQGVEVDFIGSAFLWLSDVMDEQPCERTLPVMLSGKRCGSLTVSFSPCHR